MKSYNYTNTSIGLSLQAKTYTELHTNELLVGTSQSYYLTYLTHRSPKASVGHYLLLPTANLEDNLLGILLLVSM